MAALDTADDRLRRPSDAWTWWQTRRLAYNLTLALGGWAAYGLAVGLNYAFGRPVWANAQGALSMTLFLAVAYLVVMGAANVLYLLGPAVEAWVRPDDIGRYRRAAWRMGRWGSLLVPAAFPLVQFALLIGRS